MRVEYINPFISSAMDVLSKVANMEVTRGEIKLQKNIILAPEISVLLGVVGAVHGHVIYGMDSKTAMGLASRMMMGLEVTEFDEVAQSAICEMGNMVTANATILLEKEGIHTNISPPTLVKGKDVTLSPRGAPVLIVFLNSPVGRIEINVGLGTT